MQTNSDYATKKTVSETKTIVAMFTTERFDYSGAIPDDANAGNKFYGRDVAEYLCAHLSENGWTFDFIDEDWGWLVMGMDNEGRSIDVSIYNHSRNEEPGPQEGNGTNTWSLLISAFERGKLLGFIPKRRQTDCAPSFLKLLEQVLSRNEIRLVRMARGAHPFAD